MNVDIFCHFLSKTIHKNLAKHSVHAKQRPDLGGNTQETNSRLKEDPLDALQKERERECVYNVHVALQLI